MSRAFHGILLVRKEAGGGTSHDLVARARRILGTRSVGHAGTLDPLAGGLMALLVGEGTKLSPYILEGHKAYRAVARLGLETDTFDVTGDVLRRTQVAATTDEISAAVARLEGEFQWPVPVFSAVKVNGKALHRYAREGADVQVPTKTMRFWDVQLEKIEGDRVQVHLHCSKGSYIRSWIETLGRDLGCGASMEALTRTHSAPYELAQAGTLEEIAEQWTSGRLGSCFVPMEQALPQIRKIRVKGPDQTLLMNGQISHDLRSLLITQVRPEQYRREGLDPAPVGEDLVQVHSVANQLLALVALEQGKGFTIRRVFRYPSGVQG